MVPKLADTLLSRNIRMQDTLYYFAYGSNINPDVLECERRITPLARAVACVKNYSLVFDVPGIAYVEPSFANIIPCDQSDVWGVCYKIFTSDLKIISATEGATYKAVNVNVYTLCASQPIIAVALISNHQHVATERPLLPSKRYLKLLVTGAKYHHLPNDYVEFLRATNCYHVPVFSDIFNMALKIAKPILFFVQRIGVKKGCRKGL